VISFVILLEKRRSFYTAIERTSVQLTKGQVAIMNSTGCPYLVATDDLFRYDQVTYGACDASLIAWVTMGVIAVVLRATSLTIVLKLWCRRDTKAKHGKYRNRLPIVPAMFVIALVAHVLFWVLAGLNIVSRGYAGILLCIVWSCFAIPYLIYCLKFVSLGLRAAKRLRKWKAITGDESRLAKMDPVGRVVFVLALLSMAGVFISQGIIGPIMVDNPAPLFAGIALEGVFTVLSSAFLVSHIHRLLQSYVFRARLREAN
jgi:hypothetical protein